MDLDVREYIDQQIRARVDAAVDAAIAERVHTREDLAVGGDLAVDTVGTLLHKQSEQLFDALVNFLNSSRADELVSAAVAFLTGRRLEQVVEERLDGLMGYTVERRVNEAIEKRLMELEEEPLPLNLVFDAEE